LFADLASFKGALFPLDDPDNYDNQGERSLGLALMNLNRPYLILRGLSQANDAASKSSKDDQRPKNTLAFETDYLVFIPATMRLLIIEAKKSGNYEKPLSKVFLQGAIGSVFLQYLLQRAMDAENCNFTVSIGFAAYVDNTVNLKSNSKQALLEELEVARKSQDRWTMWNNVDSLLKKHCSDMLNGQLLWHPGSKLSIGDWIDQVLQYWAPNPPPNPTEVNYTLILLLIFSYIPHHRLIQTNRTILTAALHKLFAMKNCPLYTAIDAHANQLQNAKNIQFSSQQSKFIQQAVPIISHREPFKFALYGLAGTGKTICALALMLRCKNRKFVYICHTKALAFEIRSVRRS